MGGRLPPLDDALVRGAIRGAGGTTAHTRNWSTTLARAGIAVTPAGYDLTMSRSHQDPDADSSTQRGQLLSSEQRQYATPSAELALDPDWIDTLLQSRNPSVLRRHG